MPARKWTSAEMQDQSGKLAIVTGANSGIGYETARALANKGARVILACRSEHKGNAAVARILAEHSTASVRLQHFPHANLGPIVEFDTRAASVRVTAEGRAIDAGPATLRYWRLSPRPSRGPRP